MSELRRLGPYFARLKGRYAIGAACVVGAVVLRFCVPAFLGETIDALRSGEGISADRQHELVVAGALGIVIAAVLGAVVRTTSRVMILGNSRLAVREIRRDLFDHLLVLAPSFYVRHRTGQLMSRCVNDVQSVQGLLGPVFLYLVETGVLYGVGAWFLFAAHPGLASIGLLPFPLFLWVAHRLARRVQLGTREAQERLGDVGAKVDESLSGHRVIKTLSVEDIDRDRFDELARAYASTQIRVGRVRASLTALMTFMAALGTFLVLYFGAPLHERGEITVGELVAVVFYLSMLAAPTRTLGFVLSSLQRGIAALGRLAEIFDSEPSIPSPAVASEPATSGAGAISIRGLTVDLEVPTRDATSERRRVLDGVDLEIGAGEVVGIVGPVGSGKTTLLRVLARQVEIEPGTVYLDGVDLVDVPLEELRERVGMAPQDAFLFSDSLLENVRFGAPTASRDAVMAAIEAAEWTPDLDRLPQGVDTILGERGVNLSGGQRQRTSIARVALLRPSVLLLDDTLSAVDSRTSDVVLQNLRPSIDTRTTVIVAHRLRTVQFADRIVVLEEGRVSDSGSHTELMRRDGFYRQTFEKQSEREHLARELGLGDAE